MTGYAEQLEYVQSLGLTSGDHKRQDCPWCRGTNTLSISKEGPTLLWWCYKATCDVKGQSEGTRTIQDLKAFFADQETYEVAEFVPPPYWTSLMQQEEAQAYVRRNHAWHAYQNRLADIRYDPKQDRVVFMVYQGGKAVGAVGRALDKTRTPKWLVYQNDGFPFICGTSDTGVIVEDAASACAVSPVATGIALLGTSLQSSFLRPLKRFSSLIVALDADATRKALELQRSLSYIRPTSVVRLEEDLKYLPPDEVRAVLRLTA